MQHCGTPVHRTYYDLQKRGAGLRLERAVRIVLAGLALAGALCLTASAQSPAPQESGGAAAPQSNTSPAALPPVTTVGGVNRYEGPTVQKIDFPDLPAASAKRLLDLIP